MQLQSFYSDWTKQKRVWSDQDIIAAVPHCNFESFDLKLHNRHCHSKCNSLVPTNNTPIQFIVRYAHVWIWLHMYVYKHTCLECTWGSWKRRLGKKKRPCLLCDDGANSSDIQILLHHNSVRKWGKSLQIRWFALDQVWSRSYNPSFNLHLGKWFEGYSVKSTQFVQGVKTTWDFQGWQPEKNLGFIR